MKLRMMLISVLLAFAVSGPALAQKCSPVSLRTSDLGLDSLKLFGLDGQFLKLAAKSALPARLEGADCGDANYVMVQIQNDDYLVRKKDLHIPKIDVGCKCLPPGGKAGTLGIPGGADIRYCPANQCPAR
jgi:hypothetical protein